MLEHLRSSNTILRPLLQHFLEQIHALRVHHCIFLGLQIKPHLFVVLVDLLESSA